jgi:hypothetical protein
VNFKQQLKSYLKGTMLSSDVFNLGKPSETIKNCGMPDHEIIMTQKTVKKVIASEDSKKTGHGISRQVLKGLKGALNNPVMIIKGSMPGSLLIVSDKKDLKNRPIVIAIHSCSNSKFGIKNEIRSIYGRNNFSQYLEKETKNDSIIFEDKNRANMLRPSRGVQFPKVTANIDSKDNIT